MNGQSAKNIRLISQAILWTLAFFVILIFFQQPKAVLAYSATSSCPDSLIMSPGGACLPPATTSTTGIVGSTSLPDLVIRVIQILLGLAGTIAVVMVVVGGFLYLTSAGNEEQNEKGKKTLLNALIGLAVAILSFAIVTVISGSLTNTRW